MAKMNAAQLLTYLDEVFPQIGHYNLGIDRMDDRGNLLIRLPIDDSHMRPGGTVSGPTMMTLADVGVFLALLSVLGPVGNAVTTNMSINFMRRPGKRDLLGETRLLKTWPPARGWRSDGLQRRPRRPGGADHCDLCDAAAGTVGFWCARQNKLL